MKNELIYKEFDKNKNIKYFNLKEVSTEISS